MCCGTEREVTLNCPLDCEYLLQARTRERFDEVDPKLMPNTDIRITDQFMNENDRLLGFLSRYVLEAALDTEGAVDNDVRDSLDALIKTYRTRESGLIYETRPSSLIAAAIQRKVSAALDEYEAALFKETGTSTLRDADVLGVLVFLQRVAIHWDNQRPKGRSLISFLLEKYGQDIPADTPPASPLLIL
ncbi:MAG TPA: hypothetical protein VM120_01340 [Bryobacteraceae bacterium]|nr:hypothetical protein [Bryobacteraceae bacterium]